MLCSNSAAELAHDQASKYWENDEVEVAIKARIKLLVEEGDPQKAHELIENGLSFDMVSDLIFACLDAKQVYDIKLMAALSNLMITLKDETKESVEKDIREGV